MGGIFMFWHKCTTAFDSSRMRNVTKQRVVATRPNIPLVDKTKIQHLPHNDVGIDKCSIFLGDERICFATKKVHTVAAARD